MKINQLNVTWNFCQENVSQQVAKHSKTHLFDKMVKVHVNAMQTPDSNKEPPVFQCLQSLKHWPSHTGPATHTHTGVSTFHGTPMHREMSWAKSFSRISLF